MDELALSAAVQAPVRQAFMFPDRFQAISNELLIDEVVRQSEAPVFANVILPQARHVDVAKVGEEMDSKSL